MNIDAAIKAYIQSLVIQDYPTELVNRRIFTYQRLLNTYDDFNSQSLNDFYADNKFLDREHYVLLKLDILCLLRYLEQQGLIDKNLFRDVEMG